MRKHSPYYRLVLLVAAALLFGIGYYWGGKHKPASVLEVSAVQLGTPVPLNLGGLATSDGDMFDPADLREHWTLLIMTPTEPASRDAIALFTRVRNRLADRADIQGSMRCVLIQPADITSIDSEAVPRDAGFSVLLANHSAFDRLSQTLGAEDDETTGLWLLNPSTQVVALFTPSQDVATIAADIRQFVDNY